MLHAKTKVFGHAYGVNPADVGIKNSEQWSKQRLEDFEDTARQVTCLFEDFHSYTDTIKCVDELTGHTLIVPKDNFTLVSRDSSYKHKIVVCDIDGVLTNYNPETCETLMRDGTSRLYADIAFSESAEGTYMTRMVNAMTKVARLAFLTARGESQKVPTHRFLDRYHEDYLLFMRGFCANSFPADRLKVRMLQSCILPYYDVECFIEDSLENIEKVKRVLPEIKTFLIQH